MSYKKEDLEKLYTLILKYKMKARLIPSGWLNVEKAIKINDPTHNIRDVPEYVKIILKHMT